GLWGTTCARSSCAADSAVAVAEYVDLFFFQAEDGIRDRNVTGVQTCALPILLKVKLIFVSFAFPFVKAVGSSLEKTEKVPFCSNHINVAVNRANKTITIQRFHRLNRNV